MRAKKALSLVCILLGGEASWENEARETAMVLHKMPQEFSLAVTMQHSLCSLLQMVSAVDARRIQCPGIVCTEQEKSFPHAAYHSLLVISMSTER